MGFGFIERWLNNISGLMIVIFILVVGVIEKGGSFVEIIMDYMFSVVFGDEVVVVGGVGGLFKYFKFNDCRVNSFLEGGFVEVIDEVVELVWL